MTEPLTPPDCNCQGLPFMPLEVNRLLDSDLVGLSTGDEFKAAFILWAKSWGQVPAASIPDDDRILARWVSCSLSEWSQLRPMALRNWVRCSDGRLYHPLIADLALAAAVKRRGQSERANSRWAKARAAKAAQSVPTHEKPDAVASGGDATAMQGTGTVEGREPPKPPSGGDWLDKALAGWPEAGKASTHPEKAAAEWAAASESEPPDRLCGAVIAAAAHYAAAPKGTRVPSLHRWLRERRYETWLPAADKAAAPPLYPPEVLAIVRAAHPRPGYAESYLAAFTWQDLPAPTLTTSSPTMFAKLQPCERELAEIGVRLAFEKRSAA